MGRYFFHLRDGSDQLLDPDGVELPGDAEAKARAIAAARDTLSHEMKDGKIDLRYRIDVEDAEGTVLFSMPFEDAFEIIGP